MNLRAYNNPILDIGLSQSRGKIVLLVISFRPTNTSVASRVVIEFYFELSFLTYDDTFYMFLYGATAKVIPVVRLFEGTAISSND